MKFFIDPAILADFPGVRVGLLVCKNIDNSGSHPEITALLRQSEVLLREVPGIEDVNQYPKIACWREAHRKFGNSPKKNPPSVQALVKRVVKGGELPTISPLVDLYNAISLKHVLSAGGEDTDVCTGDIRLTYADGSEAFIELGSTENRPPKPGEVIYRDDQGVICAKFNWREGDRTKLHAGTRNCVLVIEAIPPITDEELDTGLLELQGLVLQHCGGEVEKFVLQEGMPEAEF